MSIFHNNVLAGRGAVAGGYQIERSLRFNPADTAYLSRTPSVAGNRKTWTWAGWVKRGELGAIQALFDATWALNDTSWVSMRLQYDQFYIDTYNSIVTTVAVFRDPSAWYHVIYAMDTTQAVGEDRVKIYVNGIRQTTTGVIASQNADTGVNAAQLHAIGRYNYSGDKYFSGCLADVFLIDGQALDPTSFGEFDTNDVWQPIAYTGSYGTNGFHLPFSDNSTAAALGTDTSSNGNTWTVNNISVTAGAANDSLVDSPTNGSQEDTGVGGEVVGNYCTWNPLNTASNLGLANGNLDTTSFSGSSDAYSYGTIGVSSGKWYYEATPTTVIAASFYMIGWGRGNKLTSNGSDEYLYYSTGALRGASSASYGASWTAGDVIGIALDLNAGTLVFYKNGVSQGTAFTGITGTVFPKFGYWHGLGNFNFGQRPFAYTAPSGFKALCTANLAEPTIADGSTAMDVVLYTGNGSTQTISGLNFSPDFVWLKTRSNTVGHNLYDVIRGVNKPLITNSTAAEDATNIYGAVSAFNSDGFDVQIGSTDAIRANASGYTYVAWTWDAGSSTVTNTQGSITSQVRANASAGFSVVTYTGNGTNNATVGHGLGVAPRFLIGMDRTGGNWQVWGANMNNGSFDCIMNLNTTDALATGITTRFRAASSTTFTIGTDSDINANGNTYVTYCFAPVDGYSSFGSYTGNGNTTGDGAFVYLGFRPRWIMIKGTGTDSWIIHDTARNTYNFVGNRLWANLSDQEASSTVFGIDMLSNGFKTRVNNADQGGWNVSGQTYIYAAFAEHPFSSARAR